MEIELNAKFIHLHTHSHYSLLDGRSQIKGLVKLAKEHNMDAIGLTDHGVMYGAIDFSDKKVKVSNPVTFIRCCLLHKFDELLISKLTYP